MRLSMCRFSKPVQSWKKTRERNMRVSALVVTATAATWLVAGPVLAQAPAPAKPGVAQSPSPSASDKMARHTMEGEVTKVDAKKGWIDVKTPEGRMKLHFPPAALANVKKGDSVSVELGLRK
jgi:hypothetical protein